MSPTPSDDALLRAFAEAARERLIRHEPVPIPGVGMLAVQHEPSRVRHDEHGGRTLLPPRDEVVLRPLPAGETA